MMTDDIGDSSIEESAVRTLLAVGLVAGDISPSAIARYSGVDLPVAQQVLDHAARLGFIQTDGSVETSLARELVSALPSERVATIHTATACVLMTAGPAKVADAVAHARAAGPMVPTDEVIRLAAHTSRVCLSMNDWTSAEALLRLVVDLSAAADETVETEHLQMFGVALSALGQFDEARRVLTRAAEQAIKDDDGRRAVSVLGHLVTPIEWNYSDKAALSVLELVSRMDLDAEARIVLDSLRAMVESWIPLKVDGRQQFAWVSRASLSQPMTDRALNDAVEVEPVTRLTALAAWRATHRAPQFLARRRKVSSEALDLAQILRLGYFQIEAAVATGVDALESGDRSRFDDALTVARWVADQHDTRWLSWRAHTLLAGAAHLDSDLDAARRHRNAAWEIGTRFEISGAEAANTLLVVEEVLDRDDPEEMGAFYVADDEPAVAHAIGRLALAYREARVGRPVNAERSLRIAMRQLDPESSYLLTACRATEVVVAMSHGDIAPATVTDVVDDLIAILEPWVRHIAVDSYGLWCGGPVSLALAELHRLNRNPARARALLPSAYRAAQAMNDVRSLERAQRLAERLGNDPNGGQHHDFGLTDRERLVLRGIVDGKTNQAIAADLAFSLSTIRNDTSEIYRKLGVSRRSQAMDTALAAGIVTND